MDVGVAVAPESQLKYLFEYRQKGDVVLFALY